MKAWRIKFCFLPVACMFRLAFSAEPSADSAAPSAAGAAHDWPQLQCNAARTGWTPDSPAPPYRLEYTLLFSPEPLGLVQPIIYRNVMYVPTKKGRLYAVDPFTAARLWVADGLGAVTHSAAAADGLVYVANIEGVVSAVDAKDGAGRWAQPLGFGLSASPCLYEGKVYIGTRDGNVFCLDGKTGEVLWKTKLEFYIFSSLSAAEGRVYVCTENELRLYCLEAAGGRLLWRSEKMPGMFMRDFYPVVSGGKVFVSTCSSVYYVPPEPAPYHTWETSPAVFMKYYEELRSGELPEDFHKANDELVKALTEEPLKQVMFAFDAETGRQPYVMGAFYVFPSVGLSAVPPPSVDSEGKLQVPVAYGMSRFGRLDPATGKICDILVGPLRENKKNTPALDGLGTSSDECHASSCGGDLVFWEHYVPGGLGTSCSFHLRTREVGPITLNQAKQIPISVAEPDRAWRTGLVQRSPASYLAMSIWGDWMFHQAEGAVYAFRGGADTKEQEKK